MSNLDWNRQFFGQDQETIKLMCNKKTSFTLIAYRTQMTHEKHIKYKKYIVLCAVVSLNLCLNVDNAGVCVCN